MIDALMTWLYHDEPPPAPVVAKLMPTAVDVGMWRLVGDCATALVENLKVDNVSETMRVALDSHTKCPAYVTAQCEWFVFKHMPEVRKCGEWDRLFEISELREVVLRMRNYFGTQTQRL